MEVKLQMLIVPPYISIQLNAEKKSIYINNQNGWQQAQQNL